MRDCKGELLVRQSAFISYILILGKRYVRASDTLSRPLAEGDHPPIQGLSLLAEPSLRLEFFRRVEEVGIIVDGAVGDGNNSLQISLYNITYCIDLLLQAESGPAL